MFAGIGVVCGLLGALFNMLNERLTKWRTRRLATKARRLGEALFMAGFTAVLCFAIPFALPCVDTPPAPPAPPAAEARPWQYEPNGLQQMMNTLVCRRVPSGGGGGEGGGEVSAASSRYGADIKGAGRVSDAANLLLVSHDEAIKTLFHRTASGTQEDDRPLPGLSWQVCLVFFLFSYWVAVLTYGTMVPSGLFVPGIMSGASFGRLMGELMRLFFPTFVTSSPGNYALIGAAGMLGGICRMTISITVIIVECTGHMTYLLPISLTILCAKVVGDLFNEGIYDLHVRLKRYPVLPDETPPEREALRAGDVAATDVAFVNEFERVRRLVHLLQSTKHNGFPVKARDCTVNDGSRDLAGPAHGRASAEPAGVSGIILRSQLMTILNKREFLDAEAYHEYLRAEAPDLAAGGAGGGGGGARGAAPHAKVDDFLRPWFHDMTVDEIGLAEPELDLFVDLRGFVNEAAQVTLQHTPLPRVARMFRAQGLRHLLVIESCPRVVGVITRKDIICGGEEDVTVHSSRHSRARGESSHSAHDVESPPPPSRGGARRGAGDESMRAPFLAVRSGS